MIKPTTTMPFGAAASISGSPSVSSPVLRLPDEAAVIVQHDQQLAGVAETSNPVLTRAHGSQCDEGRPLTGSIVAGGAALLTSAMNSFGCTGQGDLAIAAIALGWGLATVAAWGSILLGLNWVAGCQEHRRVVPESMQGYIENGDWQFIENALLDDDRILPDIASIQLAILSSPKKIPSHWQLRIYKAIAVANGDSQLSSRALDHLLGASTSAALIRNALMDIVRTVEQKPDEYMGVYVAKALIEFEWRHKGSIPDFLLARAVVLTQDRLDTVILTGILATRIRLGYTQTNAHLFGAIKNLLQKPFGLEVYQNDLPPFLVDIEGIDIGV